METSQALLDYYDAHLARHGDTARGAAWPDEAGRHRRFRMGLDLVLEHARRGPVTLCDLGCGTGELLRFLREAGLADRISYAGVDRSSLAIGIARGKFPDARFHCLDVLAADEATLDQVLACDFVFANGLFTVKHQASQAQMWDFLSAMLRAAWPRVRRGLVFNVMSTLVDWEREDLFHVSYDEMARFLKGLAGREIGFRADRDLYEYMAFALKDATPDVAKEGAAPAANVESVPVCRPRLPRAGDILPWLSQVDDARRYTNHGSLLGEFTSGLAGTLAIADDALCLASSGTAALTGAILATAGRATPGRPLALCPAYTFTATALAAQSCGFEPVLVDVDADTWVADPDRLREHPLDRVGLVVATAAYGQAVPQLRWAAFARATGVPVVIDAAASFEQACADPAATLGPVPVVLSLHATKAFGIGEGGAVLCSERDTIARTYGALNFGFLGARECRMPGINGKLSEYHCAVGLAQLAQWPALRADFARVAQAYQAFARAHGLAGRVVTSPRVASCYALFVARDAREVQAVAAALTLRRVDFRRWYGTGLHHEPHFAGSLRDALPITDRIAPCLLGLPMAPDLSDNEVGLVVTALAAGVAARARDDIGSIPEVAP